MAFQIYNVASHPVLMMALVSLSVLLSVLAIFWSLRRPKFEAALSVVQLAPGDVVVLKVNKPISESQRAALSERVKDIFKNNRVVICDDIDVKVCKDPHGFFN